MASTHAVIMALEVIVLVPTLTSGIQLELKTGNAATPPKQGESISHMLHFSQQQLIAALEVIVQSSTCRRTP